MLDRGGILKLSTDGLDELGVQTASLSDQAVMLMGFQRTKQISKTSRKAWEAGNTGPMADEVQARRSAIINGTFGEIWQEYVPLRDYLSETGLTPTHVADVGSGTGVNDVFLARDFGPKFTLIDIEQTDDQYHGWARDGAGYASLATAEALLSENGVAPDDITLINPRREPQRVDDVHPDLATSLYSCGFHYPVDEYLDLFLRTIEGGGAVILDIRERYRRRNPPAFAKLYASGEVTEIYRDDRSVRIGIKA